MTLEAYPDCRCLEALHCTGPRNCQAFCAPFHRLGFVGFFFLKFITASLRSPFRKSFRFLTEVAIVFERLPFSVGFFSLARFVLVLFPFFPTSVVLGFPLNPS